MGLAAYLGSFLLMPWGQTPLLIQRHASVVASGLTPVSVKEPLSPVALEDPLHQLRLPRWDSVRHYDVEARTRVLAASNDASHPSIGAADIWVSLQCRDTAGRIRANLTDLAPARSAISYRSQRKLETPGVFSDGLHTHEGPAACTASAAARHAVPDAPGDLWLWWEIRIIPRWHWTHWLPRQFANDVKETYDTVSGALGLERAAY